MTLEERRKLLVTLLVDPDEAVRTAAAEVIEQLESFQDLDQIIVMADVIPFTVGYLVEHPRLRNQMSTR